MRHIRLAFCIRLVALIGLMQALAATPLSAQTPALVTVTIVVTLEDSPCPGSKVSIRPMGAVEGWPSGKPRITVTTDAKGHASVHLGPGKYQVLANNPIHHKLPADGWFLIKPGQRQPEKIYLNLLYWDCATVTCTL